MKHKKFIITAITIALMSPTAACAYNCDFSAVAPSGQTLYYKIIGGDAHVTYPNCNNNYSDYYYGFTMPTGALIIPDTVVSYNGTIYNVTSIDNHAFYGCSGLTSVTIPNSVTSIGNHAFYGCSGLTSVTIPNSVTSIGYEAFYYCYSLTSVTIGSGVTSIGGNAFYYCSGLISITIPNSVTSIGNYAFYGCSGLTSVNYTGTIAQWCNINFGTASSNPTYYAYSLGINGNLITNLVIPNSVTTIGNYAFYNCSGLTSVTIPNSVTSIGGGTFQNCSALTSVNIGSGITSIGDSAFRDCSGLTSITIPNNVTTIGNYAFYNCSGLTSITIPNNVTTIGNYAFYNCSGMTSVTIGSGVTTIASYAFYNCSGLTSVTIPNSVAFLGIYAFENCTALTSVIFNAENCSIPISFGNGFPTFGGCINLTSITFGSNVQSIPTCLCSNCEGLTSVTIPNSVTSIGNSAFEGCSSLTSVTFNADSCISAGNNVFSGCGDLTITFGNNVKLIPTWLCHDCTSLISVIIGGNVDEIGAGAFSGCSNLMEIQSLNSVAPRLVTSYNGTGPFEGVSSTIPVYIPCGSSASYYSRWSYFSDFIEEEAFTFTATSDNEQMGTVQILTMPSCTNPQAVVYASANSGYHFDHWSDGSTANPYSLTVTDDFDLIGYFASDSGTEGIGDIVSTELKMYVENGHIHVTHDGQPVEDFRVYDVMGREVFCATHTNMTPALPGGVYLVKVDDLPARRMVVIR